MFNVYAVSDHHFFHKNIIKYASRPFDINDDDSVFENAKYMIERHNETVNDNDVVIMVGDLSAGLRGRTELFSKMLKMLKGRKILVRGNHDHLPDQFYFDSGFTSVVDYLCIDTYFICHYPCIENQYTSKKEYDFINMCKEKKPSVIIHGHIHNKEPAQIDGIKRINVCVDYTPNNFYPVKIEATCIKEYFL